MELMKSEAMAPYLFVVIDFRRSLLPPSAQRDQSSKVFIYFR